MGIIIAIALVLIALATGIAMYVARESNRSKELRERIVGTLWKVPSALWYPLQGLANLFHGISFRFNSWIHDALNTEEYTRNKVRRLIRHAVGSVLHSHSNLLNSFHSRRLAKIFILLLQTISFIATYAGTIFFLGTVNPFAPLFMAFVVSGGTFYLLTYTSWRKRSGVGIKLVLLIVLLLTSTTTAYMGIFNGVVRPVERMREQYDAYSAAVNSTFERQINAAIHPPFEQALINQIYAALGESRSNANTFITGMQTQIYFMPREQPMQVSWTDAYGNVIIGVSSEEDTDALAVIAEIERIVSLTTSRVEYIENLLDNDEDEVYNALRAISEDPSKLNNSDDPDVIIYRALGAAITNSQLLLNPFPDFGAPSTIRIDNVNIQDLIRGTQNLENLNALRQLPDFEAITEPNNLTNDDSDITSATVGFLSNILSIGYGFVDYLNRLVVSEDTFRAEEIRNLVNSVVVDNYTQLNPLLDQNLQEDLSTARSAAYIENTQIMPLRALWTPSQHRGEVIFSLVVASLIDILSVLFALALVSNRKSILYFRKISSLKAHREEFLEDCLMYICLTDVEKEKISNTKVAIQDYVARKINVVMKAFIGRIKLLYLPDDLNASGYITEEDINNFSDDEKHLFLALSNAALIHPCHNIEIIEIIKSDFEIRERNRQTETEDPIVGKYNSTFKKDELYYLISKNLHVWICENFSELLQSSLQSAITEENLTSPPTDSSNDSGGDD